MKLSIIYLLLSLCCLTGLLSGCGATLSTKECNSLDWEQKGFDDAIAGQEIQGYYKYKKICSDNGVNADEHAYVAGYMAGQKNYCTEANGYSVGRKGSKLKNVCPAKSDFYKGYLAGIQSYSKALEKRSAENLTRANGTLSAGPTGSR